MSQCLQVLSTQRGSQYYISVSFSSLLVPVGVDPSAGQGAFLRASLSARESIPNITSMTIKLVMRTAASWGPAWRRVGGLCMSVVQIPMMPGQPEDDGSHPSFPACPEDQLCGAGKDCKLLLAQPFAWGRDAGEVPHPSLMACS